MTLANLAALADKATPGDWSADGERLRIQSGPHRFTTMCHTGENAALIAAAPDMADRRIG